jgi:hypothetical protein
MQDLLRQSPQRKEEGGERKRQVTSLRLIFVKRATKNSKNKHERVYRGTTTLYALFLHPTHPPLKRQRCVPGAVPVHVHDRHSHAEERAREDLQGRVPEHFLEFLFRRRFAFHELA